jgi:VWFA-related protein
MKARFETKRAVLIAALAIAMAGVIGVWAQSQDQPQAAFAERIEVRALEIDAVVMNRDGERVQGLEADDFRLLIDGEEVPIEFFAEVREGDFVQTVEAVEGMVAGQRSPTNFLIFIDDFFAMPNDRDRVLRAIAERVPRLGPQDRVAITAWDGDELAVLTGWTSSQEEAAAALEEALDRRAFGLTREQERRQFNVTTRPEDMFGSSFRDPSMGRHNLGTQERQYASLLVSQLQGVVGATNAAMRAFEPPPGRNVLILLAGGWPMEVDQFIARDPSRAVTERNVPDGAELYGPIATTANLMGFTVYPVDTPGMQARTGADASRASSAGAGAIGFTEFVLEGEIHNSLRFIAAETGGLAFLNGQRITSLSEVGADVDSFYWLSFTPQWAGSDELHDIRVEVTDPDLIVRTRANFIDVSPQTQVNMAVHSALLFGPFGGANDFDIQVLEAERAGRRRVDVTVRIVVPMEQVTVVETADGFVGELRLFVAALDRNGGRSDVQPRALSTLTRQPPVPGQTFTYEMTLELARRTSRLTAAVHDVAGNRTLISTITREQAEEQLGS